MYLFFSSEDSSCLAFKFSGLFWSAVEDQTRVKVLLLLTWLHLAQSMGRVCVLLLPEEGIRSAYPSGNLEPSVWQPLAGPSHRKDKKQCI